MECNKFADMFAHAARRISPFVDLKILPADPESLSEYVVAAPSVQQMDATDKTMYVWAAGTASESLHKDRLRRPFKYLPALEPRANMQFATFLSSLAARPTLSKHPRAVLVADGRRQASSRAISAMLTKMARETQGQTSAPTPFRLMHSNAEFATTGRNHRGEAKFSACPKPLETVLMSFSKTYKVKPVSRKYLDLPGTNRTRGLNTAPLKSKTGISVTWGRRAEILIQV